MSYYPGGKAPPPTDLGPPFDIIRNPTPAEVDEAVQSLKAAFAKKDDGLRVWSIETYAGVVHPKVTRLIAKGLTVPDPAVRMAAFACVSARPQS